MTISGLIVEYNPFHNGHQYHLNISKKVTKSEYIIAIMSGQFVQRGEPALFNKWYRTEMALKAGVDIVIELPTVYSCQSAELFSYGSIQLLEKIGIIDQLVFGTEWNNIEDLKIISQILAFEPNEYKDYLKKELKKGISFPSARSKALEIYAKNNHINKVNISSIIQSPNNILGIEYLKWIFRFQSKIIPKTIKRIGSHYYDQNLNTPFSSATAIRNHILNDRIALKKLENFLPFSSLDIIQKAFKNEFIPAQLKDMSHSILSILFRKNINDLKAFLDIEEGLDSRMIHCLTTNSIEEYIDLVKTKRYTRTRIQRILCHILLNLRKEDMQFFKENDGIQYVRILGFSNKGREILPLLKRKCNLPIITNLSKSYNALNSIQRKMIDFDILATNLYNIHFLKTTNYKKNMDFYFSPIIVDREENFK
ncbi:nucleotidyltransferase [Garciella nitratireducens]|uniref:nucleotidyltransferase n=1 Tax=Garciella nitratireducens TaxID=218205 RepID=UPI001BD58408|nr:nucleotidyltransferase [Garciella nitratireducens]